MVVSLLAFALPCAADIEVSVLSSELSAAPGAFATPVFGIRNGDPVDQTVRLEFEPPPGWQILGAPQTLDVPAEGEGSVFATVVVPEDAAAGAYAVTLVAVSDFDASDRASADASILVASVSNLEIAVSEGRSVAPGATVSYQVTLTNQGNVQDSLLLSASTSRGLDVEISQPAVDLAPRERATLDIQVRVPTTAEAGQDVLTVTATSTIYEGVEEQASIFTIILPPTPDLVGGTLMETLSGRLRLSIGRDEIDRSFDSRLSFSASGRVLDGFFSTFLSVTDPFGPDPVDVTSYSLLYRREPSTTTIGNVSKRLTDLVSLTCEGGSVEIDDDLLDLVLIAGLDDDEARFAGRFALGPEVANVGATYFEARSPTGREAIVGATASSEPIEDWRLRAEGALGTLGGQSSFAFLFGTEIDTAGYFLDGKVYSVDTQFPGSMQDSAGISLSQRLRLTDVSLSLSLGHEWDNIDRNPLLATTIDDGIGLNVNWMPIEDGPRLSSTFEFGWTREDDLLQRNQIDLLFAAGIRETEGVFPYEFSGEIDDRLDVVLGTHTRTLTFAEGAGLSVDSFYFFLQLIQEKRVDVVNDLVLSGATDVSILFRPEGTLHQASISLRNEEDELDLSVSLDVRFLETLDITFDGSIGWDRSDATPLSFDWGITFNVDLAVPLPFLVTKGRIEGRLFVDGDGDGTFREADRPIGGGVLSANGVEVSTDEDGLFRFPPLAPGVYPLEIDALPSDVAPPEAIDVTVEPGETTQVDIPLRPILAIGGHVYEDADRSGTRDVGESGFLDIGVRVEDEEGVQRTAVTDSRGSFSIGDLGPGTYTASLDPATLPARFEFTTPQTVSVVLSPTGAAPVEFGAVIRPSEVVVTIRPPAADFTISPIEPVVGEPVTFDGSVSSDIDGEIVAFAWDFDGDGTTDATEPLVERVFDEPGTFDVSLTVTDDDGNTDTHTRSVSVGGERAPSETTPEGIQTPSETPASTVSASVRPPIADFSYAPEAPEVGVPIAFDASLSIDFDGEIAAYGWDFDGDGIDDATGAAALRIYDAAGTYEVTLRVTDDGGNVDVLSRTIEVAAGGEPVDVRPTLEPPTAAFSYIPGEPVAGEPVTFDGSASSDPDGPIAGYAWDFDADGFADATDVLVEYAFPAAGTFTVTLAVTDESGAEDTVSHPITVFAAPVPPPESGDGTVLPPIADFSFAPESPLVGEPVEFNGMLSFDFDGEIAAYAWDFESDGLIDATEPIVLHVFPVAGVFSVRLTVTDTGDATDTIQKTVTVE
jgi:PKD repeat protein